MSHKLKYCLKDGGSTGYKIIEELIYGSKFKIIMEFLKDLY